MEQLTETYENSMFNLFFSTIKEVPFKSLTSLLASYELNDVNIHSCLYDFAGLLSEFSQQIKDFTLGGNVSYTYEALMERSQILEKWVDLLRMQYHECLPYLPKGFLKDQFENLLIQIHHIYRHPLLAAIWLGLEITTRVNNKKQETEYLKYIIVATHDDHELTQQFKKFLNLMPHDISTERLHALVDSVAHDEINLHFIEKFIMESAPLLFQIAALGKIDLVASALEIYHHYLLYLDKMKLKSSYHGTLRRIQQKIPKQYQHEESIYAIGEPIFDSHIAMTENFINKEIHKKVSFPRKEHQTLPVNIHSLLMKLENNIQLVCTLRGRLIQKKSENYLRQLKDILNQSISPIEKANFIELSTASWYGWVKKRYKEENILINECLSLASALAAKISNQVMINLS